jgi:hypothetical protein
MARATEYLIEKLREAASNIESGARYNWANPARCNCGHLAQCMTQLSSESIFKSAQAQQLDEWSEFANEYCPSSGAPMDDIMDLMFEAGLGLKDIHQLEYLSNKAVLKAIPGGPRYLEKGRKEHVALYMRTWAALMELELKTARQPSPRAASLAG